MSDLSLDRPKMIGRYRLLATIGSGGMADVYLAVASGPAGFNKLLVCKVLRAELAEDDTFRAMFLDEARLAAQLNHPQVTQTYEVGQDDDGHYFHTMEYLEGQPLHRVIHVLKEGLSLELRVRILTLVLAGLHGAHELLDYDGQALEVVHRDVSPHNVFVTYDGQVKILDFGIAKTAKASTLTATGVIKGKISYMAPEQALGEPVDRRTDVFAAGVMLWEALAGRRVNADDTSDVATLQRRISTPLLSPLIHRPDAPPELVSICMRALSFVASDRYATAAEMQEALEVYLDTHGKPARTRELGHLVSDAFCAQRERIKQVIELQLGAAAVDPSNVRLVDLGRDGPVSGQNSPGATNGGVPVTFEAGPPHRNVKLLRTAAVLLPLAIVVIASVRFVSRTPSTVAPEVLVATSSALHDAGQEGATAEGRAAPGTTAAPVLSSSVSAPVVATPADAGRPATSPARGGSRPAPAAVVQHPRASDRTVDDKDPYAP